MDYWVVIQQFINIKAACGAIVITTFIRYWLPGPKDPVPGFLAKFAVRSGPVIDRVIPFLPVVIAFIATYFFEKDSRYTFEDGFRGIMSGAFAAYMYKTVKTTIFGG